MPLGLFAFLATLAIIGALGTIAQRSPVHCLLALAMTLIVIAVLFIGLGAETVGFLQIIIYVGAIMVLFLFVIWLLNIQAELRPVTVGLGFKLFGSLGAAALVAELFAFFAHMPAVPKLGSIPLDYGSIAGIASMLFSDYLIAFEVTSVLLLAAVVGSVALARRMPPAQAVPAAKCDSDAAQVRSA